MNFSLIYPMLKNIMFRNFDFPKDTPRLVNFVLTYRCNSMCRMCNIWKKKPENEFTLEEFEKFIKNNKIWWIAYTGGEPFLRSDILDLWKIANKDFSITTNGFLTEKIVQTVQQYLPFNRNIGINISIDGDEKTHNFIRRRNCFKKAIATYESLRKLKEKHENLHVCLFATISKFNENNLVEFIKNNPDKDFVVRPATSSDYYNVKEKVNPHKNNIVNILSKLEKLNNVKNSKVLMNIWKDYLAKPRHLMSCYSGWSSVWINPNWDVFPCINRENFKIGNLRDVDFSMEELWFNDKIKEHREFAKKCHCPSECEIINSARYNLKYLIADRYESLSR